MEYEYLFRGSKKVLQTHRGYDLGALPIAKELAARFKAPLEYSTTTRLLVELNRSVTHPALFSEFSSGLDKEEKRLLLERHYFPFRKRVLTLIERRIARGYRVLHLSVHSFTPVLAGEARNCEFGLLYDPKRAGERKFCGEWQALLRRECPSWRTRKNYPYRGTLDGHTTTLRKAFGGKEYLGIEIEMVNSLASSSGAKRGRLVDVLENSLRTAITAELPCNQES